VVQQRVDQRAVEIAGGRVDDEAGGLVDDDQVGVLEHDHDSGYPAPAPRRGSASGTAMRNAAPGCLRDPCAAGLPAIVDAAFAQQRLYALARQSARLGQRLVEPLAAGAITPSMMLSPKPIG
jgi:hypothetical protein